MRERIQYRLAGPGDAEAIANLHARSWQEHDRGAFQDAFLDGDLPGERLRVWPRPELLSAPMAAFHVSTHGRLWVSTKRSHEPRGMEP